MRFACVRADFRAAQGHHRNRRRCSKICFFCDGQTPISVQKILTQAEFSSSGPPLNSSLLLILRIGQGQAGAEQWCLLPLPQLLASLLARIAFRVQSHLSGAGAEQWCLLPLPLLLASPLGVHSEQGRAAYLRSTHVLCPLLHPPPRESKAVLMDRRDSSPHWSTLPEDSPSRWRVGSNTCTITSAVPRDWPER